MPRPSPPHLLRLGPYHPKPYLGLPSRHRTPFRLLPPPVERTADLSKVLSHNMLSKAFNSKVSELRATLSAQLATPKMWAGRPITGPALAKLVPVVCEALNRNESVMPKSMYESM